MQEVKWNVGTRSKTKQKRYLGKEREKMKVRLIDLEPGTLFEFNGTFALKTEYRTDSGATEAYIVGSGEMFWGGTNTAEEQCELMVEPFELKELGNRYLVEKRGVNEITGC